MNVNVKKAEELDAIVLDLDDNVTSLKDDLATLQDVDTKGGERAATSQQVRETFENLCSNVRAFAKAAKFEADLS